jgi:hypothetical protein
LRSEKGLGNGTKYEKHMWTKSSAGGDSNRRIQGILPPRHFSAKAPSIPSGWPGDVHLLTSSCKICEEDENVGHACQELNMFLKSSNLFDMYTMHIYIYIYLLCLLFKLYMVIYYIMYLSLSLYFALFMLSICSLSLSLWMSCPFASICINQQSILLPILCEYGNMEFMKLDFQVLSESVWFQNDQTINTHWEYWGLPTFQTGWELAEIICWRFQHFAKHQVYTVQ